MRGTFTLRGSTCVNFSKNRFFLDIFCIFKIWLMMFLVLQIKCESTIQSSVVFPNFKRVFLETMFLKFVDRIEKNRLNRLTWNFNWLIYRDNWRYPRSGFLKSFFFLNFTAYIISKKTWKWLIFMKSTAISSIFKISSKCYVSTSTT